MPMRPAQGNPGRLCRVGDTGKIKERRQHITHERSRYRAVISGAFSCRVNQDR